MKTSAVTMKLSARLMARLMYKPAGPVRPSAETVINRTLKDTGFDLDAYRGWEREEIRLENDGVRIPAVFYPVPGAKGTAVLAHGYGQNRCVLIPQAEIFRELGWNVILFDQRHFGESRAKNGTFSVKEAGDVAALAGWAKQKCGQDFPVAALGVSMGAMSVMNAISQTSLIDAAIEDCGPARLSDIYETFFEVSFGFTNPYFPKAVQKESDKYGVDASRTCPIESVARSDTPLLVIHSKGDRTVPVKLAPEILAASKNPLSRMQLFGEQYDHAYSINDRALYKETVSAFLRDVFGQ